MMRVLWLSRVIPFPQVSGDRVYSAHLAQALAAAGGELTFVGLQPQRHEAPSCAIRWSAVPAQPRPALRALFSRYPLVAAAHAVPEYVRRVRCLFAERWDAVVLDQYAMGWALDHALQAKDPHGMKPVLVYVAHNH
jgi:polysaccharide biosynthesis protein PslH